MKTINTDVLARLRDATSKFAPHDPENPCGDDDCGECYPCTDSDWCANCGKEINDVFYVSAEDEADNYAGVPFCMCHGNPRHGPVHR